MSNLFRGGVILEENTSSVTPPADRLLLHSTDRGAKTEPRILDSGGEGRYLFQDSYFVGQNTTGAALAKGTVVRVTSLVGSDIPVIAAADADTLATMPAAGILMESVANNAYGRVMFQGVLTGLNTGGMTAGSPLYASGTAGGFTQTAPVYPAYRQVLGSVLSVNATTGVVLVNVSHYFQRTGTPVPAVFFTGSALTVATGVGRWVCTTNMAGTITEVRAAINTAPTGAAVNLSVKKNGTQFTTLSIAASANAGSSTGLSTPLAAGDYVTVDITQIGSTVAGSDLVVVGEIMAA